jgi:hypothetical protein
MDDKKHPKYHRSIPVTEDQKISTARDFYDGLDATRKEKFRKWVFARSEGLPEAHSIDELEMYVDVGLNENWTIGLGIILQAEGKQPVCFYPPLLKQAIAAWDRGEDFTPDVWWYVFENP